MTTSFAENEVEVLKRYLPAELHEVIRGVRAELTRTRVDSPEEVLPIQSPELFDLVREPLTPSRRQSQQRAIEVNDARRRFLAVLDRASLGLQEPPTGIQILDQITDDVMRHELPGAIARLAGFNTDAPPVAGLQLDGRTIETALTSEPVEYFTTKVTKIINTPQGPKEIRLTVASVLPGYRTSTKITDRDGDQESTRTVRSLLHPADIDQLMLLLSFLSNTPERTFRLGIIEAEAQLGLGKYEEALRKYGELLPGSRTEVVRRPEVVIPVVVDRDGGAGESAESDSGSPLTWVPRDVHVLAESVVVVFPTVLVDEQVTTRDKFVALRSGFAQLGLGDALFRKFRQPDPEIRTIIRAAYNSAINLARSGSISPENPARQQIEQYAAMQMAKLDAELNVLGYRDSYVPILKPATLQAMAERRIQAAAEAAQKFEAFKSRADQIQDQLSDLDFQREIKAIELAIADEQITTAEARVTIATEQVKQIDHQINALETTSLTDFAGSLLQGAASGFFAGSTSPTGGSRIVGTSVPGIVGAVAGIASTVVGYSARKDDLEFQKRIAEIEERIARRDVTIAQLGKQVVETTTNFLGARIERIQNRELNPDLYYAAAELFRGLAERHLDTAILWAYLFERAVSFLRLEPDLRKIQLDYLRDRGGLLTAADRLRADLNDVADVNVPITKFQLLTETYSLRSLYPLEFNRFLQTGRMDFALSLYELNKRRPGVYRQRIKRVQVVLQSPPVSGFTGRIRHRGSFLLRDRDSTPEPGAGPFMPSGEQLEAAFVALGAGATQGVSIGGVMPFLLDVDTLELSPDGSQPEPSDLTEDVLAPIEGYGPAGDWTLEVENVDMRFITEALLRITYVIPESDEPLANRVKGLIAAHEQELLQGDALDLISAFSLDQRSPDALDQLASGQVQLTMVRNDFPTGIADLKLKTIVVQALDGAQKGVQGVILEIARPGTSFRRERTTDADGFSEDLTTELPVLPREQRFAVEGTYTLRLVNPAQPNPVKDLLLFFLYEFREV